MEFCIACPLSNEHASIIKNTGYKLMNSAQRIKFTSNTIATMYVFNTRST